MREERGMKRDCPGCQALKAQDWADRWPVGACSVDCLILTPKQRRLRKQREVA